MINMPKNNNLKLAKQAKNDEFYTQSSDIEAELKHYREHFKDQIVYCNCDDPIESNFWHYFYRSFGFLGLKKLISTHYEHNGKSSYALIYEGGYDNAPKFNEGVKWVPLQSNGDFRSPECVKYLKESDIVVTNEPWSLTREYIKQLFQYDKKFLIIVNKNAITYKEIFPLLMNRQMWIGETKPQIFNTPSGKTKKVAGLARWFTNLPLNTTTDQVVIWKSFNQDDYPAYDNYAAFEVSKVANLPKDTVIKATVNSNNLQNWIDNYDKDLKVLSDDGTYAKVKIQRPIWGVPITFMDKYNPSSSIKQHNLGKDFTIKGCTESEGIGFSNGIWDQTSKVKQPLINGKRKYKRLFIRHTK